MKVIVCDRPNPIGGVEVEGITLEPGNESFVGQYPIPTRHGLTIGELARLFNEHFGIGADLEVVPMEGWRRAMFWDDTGLPWVMPSPNIPTLDSAMVFPGAVHIEGTNASEGRGTTRPFELVGAPWVRAEAFAAALNARGLPGVYFRAVVFEPTFQKHARVPVRRLPDPRARSSRVQARAHRHGHHRRDACRRSGGFAMEAAAVRIRTRQSQPIDVIAGRPWFRAAIDAGERAEEIAGAMGGQSDGVPRRCAEPFLLY